MYTLRPSLTREVTRELQQILSRDSEQACPVVKSISLDFWETLKQWVRFVSYGNSPLTIGLAGASGSGKSLVRDLLIESLSQVAPVSSFTQDNYFRDFSADFPHWSVAEFYDRIDFDDPAHIQFEALIRDLDCLQTMALGETLLLPRLIYGTPQAKPTVQDADIPLPVAPFLVTEGIHAFYSEALRARYHVKIYVDVDEATRRARWLARNQRDNRGITDNMWQTTVTCLNTHILPNRRYADLVLDNTAPREEIAAFLQELIDLLVLAAQRAA